jgi:hypothetical protein
LVGPHSAWLQPSAYRFRAGQLGEKLQSSAAAIGVEPVQPQAHVATVANNYA